MKNKVLIITVFTITILLLSGCNNKNKTITCKKKVGEINYTVTIKKVDKVNIITQKEEFICIDNNICNNSTSSDYEESNKDFNKVVKRYRRDGYDCE